MLLCTKKQRGNFRFPFTTEAVGVCRHSPPDGISSMKRSQILPVVISEMSCSVVRSVGQGLGYIFKFITHLGRIEGHMQLQPGWEERGRASAHGNRSPSCNSEHRHFPGTTPSPLLCECPSGISLVDGR